MSLKTRALAGLGTAAVALSFAAPAVAAPTPTPTVPPAVAQAATDMKNVVRRKLMGYVGFANLPNQWHRKSVRKGFNFNVMVVGECHLFVFSPVLGRTMI